MKNYDSLKSRLAYFNAKNCKFEAISYFVVDLPNDIVKPSPKPNFNLTLIN